MNVSMKFLGYKFKILLKLTGNWQQYTEIRKKITIEAYLHPKIEMKNSCPISQSN